MRGLISILLPAMILAAPARACYACESDEDLISGIYAYMDTTGMTDDQIAVEKQKLLVKYHEKQMALARASFIARFNLYSDETQVAGAPAAGTKVASTD